MLLLKMIKNDGPMSKSVKGKLSCHWRSSSEETYNLIRMPPRRSKAVLISKKSAQVKLSTHMERKLLIWCFNQNDIPRIYDQWKIICQV